MPKCDHPDCTGRHSTSGPVAELCPRAWEGRRIYAQGYRDRRRENYAAMDGATYNRLLLRHRRNKALTRQRQRHTTEEV